MTTNRTAVIESNRAAARDAGLSYVTDAEAGIRRKRRGGAFHYLRDDGRALRDPATLERITSLVIPPAWRDVWICRRANGHIQAIGRDARGRKQYRYHPRWNAARGQSKYDHVLEFARVLPKIRSAVRRDLARKGLPREKVLAAVVAVIEKTFIRVGNQEYARQNDSYGLTTMHDKHVAFRGRLVTFEFSGKSGVDHKIEMHDAQLAGIIRRCRDLPGEQLFQYVDGEKRVHDVNSNDVNDYLRRVSGADFTAKDFRTWAGTVLAARALREFEPFKSKTHAKRNVVAAIELVAQRLGNTRAVCRRCYVHPGVFEAYLDGALAQSVSGPRSRRSAASGTHLHPDESAVLALLGKQLGRSRRAA